MRMMKAAQYPNLSREDADKLHRYVHEKAYPSAYQNKSFVSPQDAMKQLMGGG